METRFSYAAVGLFVVGLTTALVVIIIWITVGLFQPEWDRYEIDMRESVAGLEIKSPVFFNGVNKGEVESIDLNPQDPKTVVIIIRVFKGDTPINRGTTATLLVKFLSGEANIGLKSDGDTRPIPILPGHRYPVIPTTPSLGFRLENAFTKLTDDFGAIGKSITQLLDQENQAAIKNTLQSLEHFSDHANVISQSI